MCSSDLASVRPVAARRSIATVTRAQGGQTAEGDRIADVSQIVVPEELIGIRAYVRWEEAGMPEDTPPEWQAAEYAKARLDLQLEVLKGASLNDIRRKYNQDTVEGDDEPMNVGDANVMLDDAAEKFSDGVTSTVTSNVVPMETRPTPLEDFAPTIDIPGTSEDKKAKPPPAKEKEIEPEEIGRAHV